MIVKGLREEDKLTLLQSAEAWAGITAGNSRFTQLLASGDAERAVESYFTRNASLLLPDGESVKGAERIATLLGEWLDAGNGDLALQSADVEQSGNLACEIGSYSFAKSGSAAAKSGIPDKQITRGNYLAVWKRQPNNDWRVTAVSYSGEEWL